MGKIDRLSYGIITLIMLLLHVGCADDADLQPVQDVQFCVKCSWHNGRGGETRANPLAESLLADGTGSITIDQAVYPATINVLCSDGKDFILTKGSGICSTHNDYCSYTSSIIFNENEVTSQDLTFTATAVIDDDNDPATPNDGDRLTGTATKADIHDSHLSISLHHTKALMRFAFKVNEKYDQIRFIKVTAIKLNGTDCHLIDKVLQTSSTLIAYTYVDPSAVTVTSSNTLACTYNIYDKDAKFDGTMDAETLAKHLTRKDIVAENTFTLSSLKDVSNQTLAEIKAGYYYDLNITINPDYLYVLSDHDNKHMTIY